MSEQKKVLRYLLIAFAVVVAVLITIVIIVSVNPKPDDEKDDKTSVQLFSFETEKIKSVSVKTVDDGFTLLQNNGKITINELKGLKLNDTALSQFLKDISDIVADDIVVRGASNVAIYGLDKPNTITVKMADGTARTLKIGDEAPLGGTYVALDNTNTVYIIEDGAKNISLLKESFIDLDLIDNPNTTDKNGNVKVENAELLTLSGAIREEPIKIAKDDNNRLTESEYVIQSDRNIPANDVVVSNILSQIAPFSADEALVPFPDEMTLSNFGLDVPRSIIEFTVGGKTHKIILGDKYGGEYYVMVDSINCIFSVNGEYVPWAELSGIDLYDEFLFEPIITDVSEMEFTYQGKKLKFNVKADKYGSDYALSQVMLNNKDYDIDSFKELYYTFALCNSAEESEDIKAKNLLMTVKVKLNGESEYHTLQYYKTDDDSTCLFSVSDMMSDSLNESLFATESEPIYELIKVLDSI